MIFENRNKFPYLTQTDKRWCNNIMTYPEWQSKPDIIGDYFCLNTSFLNFYNDWFNKQITPEQLNDLIIEKDGYEYLMYKKIYKNDLNKVKNACLNRESFVDVNLVCELLNIKELNRDYKGKLELEIPNYYYIIKVPLAETGHYCNIIKNDYSYFDVYDGKIKKPKKILSVSRIIF